MAAESLVEKSTSSRTQVTKDEFNCSHIRKKLTIIKNVYLFNIIKDDFRIWTFKIILISILNVYILHFIISIQRDFLGNLTINNYDVARQLKTNFSFFYSLTTPIATLAASCVWFFFSFHPKSQKNLSFVVMKVALLTHKP